MTKSKRKLARHARRPLAGVAGGRQSSKLQFKTIKFINTLIHSRKAKQEVGVWLDWTGMELALLAYNVVQVPLCGFFGIIMRRDASEGGLPESYGLQTIKKWNEPHVPTAVDDLVGGRCDDGADGGQRHFRVVQAAHASRIGRG